MSTLKVVLIKPSKYGIDGYVERFKTGFMPNATLYHIAGLTPNFINSTKIDVYTVDEHVKHNLDYLKLLEHDPDCITLLAIVGVQSHQFQRALDLAAFAKTKGVEHCIIGGPHPMTCDTTQFHNRGVSFSLAEAEIAWMSVLEDAIAGELKPVYGLNNRWAKTLPGHLVKLPSKEDLEHYVVPLLGLYPVRGCPYDCDYCSVIKISGQQVRSMPVECILENLRLAKDAGIEVIFFVSDNFNKYPDAELLLEGMIECGLTIPFTCQCDAQIARQPSLVDLLGRAGCREMFVGVESFNKESLKQVNKHHNQPDKYQEIVRLCRDAGIDSHLSNIIGFPADSEESIHDQLATIQSLNPDVSSFYVLTPVPGTEQYANFKREGLLFEKNIDRYDTTNLTWRHPTLSPTEMTELLYRCYIDFYTMKLKSGNLSEIIKKTALAFRHYAKQKMHPMSGGMGKLNLDRADNYIHLRKQVFDVELVPLPNNLVLTPTQVTINKIKKLGETAN